MSYFNRYLLGGFVASAGDNCTTSSDIFGDGSDVALYRMQGNAADDSGNSFNGTATDVGFSLLGGAQPATGRRFGGGAAFNGSSSVITPPAFGNTYPFTYSVWIKPNSVGATSIITDTISGNRFLFGTQSSSFSRTNYFLIGQTGQNHFGTASNTVTANTWSHVVLVATAVNNYSFYINGVPQTLTNLGASIGGTAAYAIGANGAGSEHFDGFIDQVRIFNRSVSDAEARTLYNDYFCQPGSTAAFSQCTTDTVGYPIVAAGGTGDGNTVAFYKLDEAQGTTGAGSVIDSTTGANNGTPTDVVFGDQGYLGRGAVFNGTSSSITAPVISVSTITSVSVWLNSTNTTDTDRNGVIEINVGTSGYAGTLSINYRYSDGEILVRSGDSTSSQTDILTHFDTSLRDGNWHNLIVTRNESTGVTVLYIDGIQADTETVASTSTVGNLTYIGDRSVITPGNFNWDGSIDQVRIFDVELTAAQARQLYEEVYCDTGCTTSTVDYQGTTPVSMRFDGDFTDDSGGTDGLSTATLFSPGKFDLALTLNGAQSVSRTASSLGTFNVPESDRTVSIWFKATTLSKRNIIWYEEKIGSFNFQVELGTTNRIEIGGGAGFTTPDIIAIDTWYHLAVTLVQSTGFATVYLNGSPIGTGTTGAVIATGTFQCLGHSSVGLTGQVDQLKIYGSVLTAGQISNLANEVSCT